MQFIWQPSSLLPNNLVVSDSRYPCNWPSNVLLKVKHGVYNFVIFESAYKIHLKPILNQSAQLFVGVSAAWVRRSHERKNIVVSRKVRRHKCRGFAAAD
jgi:hypothetical protein